MVDRVTFEVLHAGLRTVASEMKLAVMRTAYSPIVASGGDMSVGIADAHGHLVAQGKDIPAQLGALPYSLDRMLSGWTGTLSPGDVLIGNDPYRCGSNHINDVCLIMPSYLNDELLGYVATRVHWTDIGGGTPGSFNPRVSDMYGEGLLIPTVKIYSGYELVHDVAELIFNNVRGARERRWDLYAGFAGCVTGERGVQRLAQRKGTAALRETMAEAIRYTDRRLRAAIAEVPDGDYHAVDWMEGDGWVDEPIRLEATVRVTGEEIEIDFTGTADAVKGGVNSPLPTTGAVAIYAVKAVLDPEIPANHGLWGPVRVTAPEGSLVNPLPPAPSQSGVAETAQRLADLLMMCFAEALPERVTAGGYSSSCMVIVDGPDQVAWRRKALGRGRVVVMEMAPGGMGARATKDGVSGIKVHTGNAMVQPVEVVEFNAPVRLLRWERVPDTGGPGRQRGGCAAAKEFVALEDGINFTVMADRAVVPPFGLFDGCAGAPGAFVATSPDGTEKSLPSKHEPIAVPKGGRFLLQPAGAGGYGNPLDRPIDSVVADQLDGYISAEGASHYGVVLRSDGSADEDATRRLRAQLANEASTGPLDRGSWTYGDVTPATT